MAVFVQDPEIYLLELGVELNGFLRRDDPAILDVEHRAFINHDTFFFADLESRKRFLATPTAFLDRIRDPVSGEIFAPESGSPHTVFGDRAYYFESAETRASFAADPDKYANAMGEMSATIRE